MIDPKPRPSGEAELVRAVFSGTKAEDVIQVLMGGDGPPDLRNALERWLMGIGYWRANIRTFDCTTEKLSYWHRDRTNKILLDRLTLPFVNISTGRFRTTGERENIEDLWYRPADPLATTSRRCVSWLKMHEIPRIDLQERPICVIQPGEIALSLLLSKPELVIPDVMSEESKQSCSKVPITFDQIAEWIRTWLTGKTYTPDSFRDDFLGKVGDASALITCLDAAKNEGTLLASVDRFHSLAMAQLKITSQDVRNVSRVRLDEWQLAGTRSILLWPILRIVNEGHPDGLEVYALVVPQPQFPIKRDSVKQLREAIDLLFQQTIAPDLLRVERKRMSQRHAELLHMGLQHEFGNLGAGIQAEFHNLSNAVKDEAKQRCGEIQSSLVGHCTAASEAARSHLEAYTADKRVRLSEVIRRVREALPWSDFKIFVVDEAQVGQLRVPNAFEYVLIELGRNVKKHGMYDDSHMKVATISVTVLGEQVELSVQNVWQGDPAQKGQGFDLVSEVARDCLEDAVVELISGGKTLTVVIRGPYRGDVV